MRLLVVPTLSLLALALASDLQHDGPTPSTFQLEEQKANEVSNSLPVTEIPIKEQIRSQGTLEVEKPLFAQGEETPGENSDESAKERNLEAENIVKEKSLTNPLEEAEIRSKESERIEEKKEVESLDRETSSSMTEMPPNPEDLGEKELSSPQDNQMTEDTSSEQEEQEELGESSEDAPSIIDQPQETSDRNEDQLDQEKEETSDEIEEEHEEKEEREEEQVGNEKELAEQQSEDKGSMEEMPAESSLSSYSTEDALSAIKQALMNIEAVKSSMQPIHEREEATSEKEVSDKIRETKVEQPHTSFVGESKVTTEDNEKPEGSESNKNSLDSSKQTASITSGKSKPTFGLGKKIRNVLKSKIVRRAVKVMVGAGAMAAIVLAAAVHVASDPEWSEQVFTPSQAELILGSRDAIFNYLESISQPTSLEEVTEAFNEQVASLWTPETTEKLNIMKNSLGESFCFYRENAGVAFSQVMLAIVAYSAALFNQRPACPNILTHDIHDMDLGDFDVNGTCLPIPEIEQFVCPNIYFSEIEKIPSAEEEVFEDALEYQSDADLDDQQGNLAEQFEDLVLGD